MNNAFYAAPLSWRTGMKTAVADCDELILKLRCVIGLRRMDSSFPSIVIWLSLMARRIRRRLRTVDFRRFRRSGSHEPDASLDRAGPGTQFATFASPREHFPFSFQRMRSPSTW